MGVAPVSIASLHPLIGGAKIRDWNGCHTHFLGSYFVMCICVSASECNVTLGQYCIDSQYHPSLQLSSYCEWNFQNLWWQLVRYLFCCNYTYRHTGILHSIAHFSLEFNYIHQCNDEYHALRYLLCWSIQASLIHRYFILMYTHQGQCVCHY